MSTLPSISSVSPSLPSCAQAAESERIGRLARAVDVIIKKLWPDRMWPEKKMAERVARSVHGSIWREPEIDWDDCHPNYQRAKIAEARIAIAAMREPSAAMISQGAIEGVVNDGGADGIWRAMVDAALN